MQQVCKIALYWIFYTKALYISAFALIYTFTNPWLLPVGWEVTEYFKLRNFFYSCIQRFQHSMWGCKLVQTIFWHFCITANMLRGIVDSLINPMNMSWNSEATNGSWKFLVWDNFCFFVWFLKLDFDSILH